VSWLPPLLGAIAGGVIGSFLATLILRWSRGEQVITGRSRCDSCGAAVRALAMVPVLSYVIARGRCRACGAGIDPLHIQVELACALLGALAVGIQPNLSGAFLALFWLMLVAPAVLDARHMWLPDALTGVLAAAGLLFGGAIAGVPLADRLIGGAAGFASLTLIAYFYRGARGREGLGAGDPKLLGAIGLWTGWAALPVILLLAALAGIGVALTSGRGRFDQMPFGTLLAVAAMIWSGLAAAGYPLPATL
jgi:leader peptidase (prepilin peptidase)/N-methyltransferase